MLTMCKEASLSKVAGEERVSTYVCDVSDPAVVAAVCTVIKENHRVDILINNAGVVTGKPFENITERDLQKTFGVNGVHVGRCLVVHWSLCDVACGVSPCAGPELRH